MPKTIATLVKDLHIDLHNFRTVEQPDYIQAVQAMISIDSERFWALMESLLEDGYLPTENIIVLETGAGGRELLVKEGNRRIAALKLIHGHLPTSSFPIPEKLITKIAALPQNWKLENEQVPCTIYPASDAAIVDKIVTLTHGKGESAGRAQWNAVARARHNRDYNKAAEHGLDLLEKYLIHGENLNKQQAKRWAGDFTLSVLDEAIGKIASRFDVKNGPELARSYPNINNKAALDDLIRDIGIEIITFSTLRHQGDFLSAYMPQPSSPQANSNSQPSENTTPASPAPAQSNSGPSQQPNTAAASQSTGQQANSGSTASTSAGTQSASGKKPVAVAIGDPRVVKRALRKFVPLGNNRQKVVTLRDEAKKLKLDDNPIAFCFLLRSMFEISAKAYCGDHAATGGPSIKKTNGDEKSLTVILGEITNHLTKNNVDKAMAKVLHGAMTELGRHEGILSVTSMNQLVHNPSFSVAPSDIATLFNNVSPLLEAMNG